MKYISTMRSCHILLITVLCFSLMPAPAESHVNCDSLANATSAAATFYAPLAGFQVGYYLAKFISQFAETLEDPEGHTFCSSVNMSAAQYAEIITSVNGADPNQNFKFVWDAAGDLIERSRALSVAISDWQKAREGLLHAQLTGDIEGVDFFTQAMNRAHARGLIAFELYRIEHDIFAQKSLQAALVIQETDPGVGPLTVDFIVAAGEEWLQGGLPEFEVRYFTEVACLSPAAINADGVLAPLDRFLNDEVPPGTFLTPEILASPAAVYTEIAKVFATEVKDALDDLLPPEFVNNEPLPSGPCLFTADFIDGRDDFVFADDPQDPDFASGSVSGDALNIRVGGVNNDDIFDMHGSWNRSCALASPEAVVIEVTAGMTQSSQYEAEELSELRLTLNGSTNVLATLTGDGNGGGEQTTGIRVFSFGMVLPAGVNTISLGCFNNQKTLINEVTDCVFDRVSVSRSDDVSCTVNDDFEGGAAGWFNDGASTCTSGAYVLGDPSQVTNGGIITQVEGSNSGLSSFFTAANTSAGVDDVDGGNCILNSPVWPVVSASTLSASYWHGQRDGGDDPTGDFFLLEYSTDGGASWNPLAAIGDSTSSATWSTVTAQIPANSSVQVRAQCSDGASTGDLIECGMDDVSICDN